MNQAVFRIAVAFTLILTATFVSSGMEFERDLDLDGAIERVEIDPSQEMSLRVFRGKELLWEAVPSRWKPWKLMAADVDGDGKREIVVGVFKSTKFFPKPHNCLFIYGWSGDKGFPKWLGSSLGRPFTDFAFVNLEDHEGEELAALETTLSGERSLAVYHWNSFGFTRFREYGPWKSAEISAVDETKFELEADGARVLIDLENRGNKK